MDGAGLRLGAILVRYGVPVACGYAVIAGIAVTFSVLSAVVPHAVSVPLALVIALALQVVVAFTLGVGVIAAVPGLRRWHGSRCAGRPDASCDAGSGAAGVPGGGHVRADVADVS